MYKLEQLQKHSTIEQLDQTSAKDIKDNIAGNIKSVKSDVADLSELQIFKKGWLTVEQATEFKDDEGETH